MSKVRIRKREVTEIDLRTHMEVEFEIELDAQDEDTESLIPKALGLLQDMEREGENEQK